MARLRLNEVSGTPTAPPPGNIEIYAKTDDVVYVLDSAGNETPIGTPASLTDLTGDVSASGPGSAVATVNSVGGKTAAAIATSVDDTQAATSLNTFNTIVKRDGSGNIFATNLSGSTSGTNTGDVNLTAVGSSPNANSASLSGQSLTLQPANGTNPGLITAIAQTIGGIKTFLAQLLISDATQSTDKDTGSLVTEGGIGVEKNINAGGNINAVGTVTGSNLSGSTSGTNTGDVTVTDTNSIDLTLAGQNVSAALKLSADVASAGSVKSTNTIHSDGLHTETPYGSVVQIGTSNFDGAGAGFALFDHVHAHGNQTSGSLHAAATTSVNGFMSSADKTKLDNSTSANTPSTLVLRDSSGNFSAGTITANLTGNASGSAASFTGSLVGDVTGTQGATVVSTVGTKSASAIAQSVVDTIAATALNTASTIVKRDASGNFAAGIITANLTGNASGSAASFTGPLVGDVIGTQGATLISTGAVTDTKASLSNKPAVTVVATTNQTLSGLLVIDGQTTTATSVVLLTAQTTGSENGPWQASAGAWTRPTWYPSGGTTQAFQFITTLIRLGTTYRGTTWRMTTSGPITIDTTATTWVVTAIALNPSTIDGAKVTATFLNRVAALTDAATIATDASLGNTFTVTLGGNRTLGAPTNPVDGQKITYRIRQDGTGNRTLAFNAIFRFGLDIDVNLSTGANKTDYIGCIYHGTDSKWDVVAVSKGF